jgi:hypothetical protein
LLAAHTPNLSRKKNLAVKKITHQMMKMQEAGWLRRDVTNSEKKHIKARMAMFSIGLGRTWLMNA